MLPQNHVHKGINTAMCIYDIAIFFLPPFACLSCSLQLGFCLLDVRVITQILRIIFPSSVCLAPSQTFLY